MIHEISSTVIAWFAPGQTTMRLCAPVSVISSVMAETPVGFSGSTFTRDTSTPAAAAGLTSNTGAVPYALCTAWAEYPGYYMLEVENVQIFPGVETVQNMELIPLEYGQDSLQSPTVQDTPAQDL